MLERLRVVVFSAKNYGGVHFGGHIGSPKCPKNGYFEANPKNNMFPNTQSVLEWPGIN